MNRIQAIVLTKEGYTEIPPTEEGIRQLIHELVVARANEYTVEEIELAIHAHPTLSEAIAEAALDSMGRVIHI